MGCYLLCIQLCLYFITLHYNIIVTQCSMKDKIMISILLLAIIFSVSARYFTLKDRRFFDPENGEITFHGLNVVEKTHPYEARLSEEEIQSFKKWGINAIRTDIAWPGLEPKKGQWNETYLKYKLDLINRLGEQGIYTLLQFHQDLFSERFCGGGVPTWIIPEQVYHDYGRPIFDGTVQFTADGTINNCYELLQNTHWSSYYRSYAINRAFKALYGNHYGILDGFKRYWRKIAETFKDNKYIIAYEIINEPWPGNLYKNPLIMIPGLSEAFNLQGFHDQVARQIRTIDPDQNIGFEPVTWLNGFPAGFSHPPGGKEFADRSVLCWHYYDPPTKGMHIFMGARKLDMKRLGVGGLLTQFMAIPNTIPGTDPNEYFEEILNICDKQHISWFGWDFRPGLNLNFIVRTYAQRTGGKIVEQKFNSETKSYHLYYEAKIHAGLTKIYFSKNQYPHGFILTLDPKVPFTVTEDRFIVIDSKHIGNRLMVVRLEVPDFKKQWKDNFEKQAVVLQDVLASSKKQSMMKEQQMKQSTNGTSSTRNKPMDKNRKQQL